MSAPSVIVGLDLGGSTGKPTNDRTALAILEVDRGPVVEAPRTTVFFPADGSRPRPLPRVEAAPRWLAGERTTDALAMPVDRCPRCHRVLWRRTVEHWACEGCGHPHGLPFPVPAAPKDAPDERPVLIRHLQRYPLGTKYTAIVEQVAALMASPFVAGAELLVDATGVGIAVCDLLDARGVRHTRVTIGSGNKPIRDGRMWSVPKRDLVGAVQVLLQARRLKLARGSPRPGRS